MLEASYYYFPAFLTLAEFFELGGPVLYAIGFTGVIMWCFVIERFLFLMLSSKQVRQSFVNQWVALNDQTNWTANQLKTYWLSTYSQQLDSHLLVIKTCIAISPLLGLLGTVTGMIQVFDVMAISGLGNTRAMSDGIAKATVPTMAGMIISLSGFMVITFLQQKITADRNRLTQQLAHR